MLGLKCESFTEVISRIRVGDAIMENTLRDVSAGATDPYDDWFPLGFL